MARGRRGGPRPLKRRQSFRRPKALFILFCEGANTEPSYFAALRTNYPQTLISIEIIRAVGVPATIASKAVARARDIGVIGVRSGRGDSYEAHDQVWAVFDCDEHPKLNDAMQSCADNGVGIAFSNPCFELWLILHFEAFDKPGGRQFVQSYLARLCPEYDSRRGKTLDCAALLKSLPDAERRAEKQQEARNKEGMPNGEPSTSVFKLTRAIRDAGKQAK